MGGPIAASGKTLPVHECFQDKEGLPVLRFPVDGNSLTDAPQNLAGQVGNTNPVEDQKAGVVGHTAQPLRSLFYAPSDPLIPGRALPSRRPEDHASQGPLLGTANPILQVLTHPAAIAQVMVTGYAGL